MWGNLHIAEKRNAMACLVAVVLLLLNNICLAQQTERLPDSVYAADSTVAPFESAAIDTAKSSSGEEEGEIRDTILLRAVPDSSVHRMVSDEDFTYANDPDYWKKEPVTNNAGYWDKFFAWIHSRWFRALLYIVLGSILLFAIFRIVVENKLYLFYRSSPIWKKGSGNP